MFFSGIIVKECLQIINEVVFIVGNLQIGHYNIVGSIGPVVLCLIIDSIRLARKVKPLHDELAILLQKRAPLD